MQIEMDEDMLVYAVRYGLGRRSYAVYEIVREVRIRWPELSVYARTTIQKDIRDHRKRSSLGDPCDERDWLSVLQLSVNTEVA